MDALGLIFLASRKKGDVWLGFWGGIWVSGIQGLRSGPPCARSYFLALIPMGLPVDGAGCVGATSY